MKKNNVLVLLFILIGCFTNPSNLYADKIKVGALHFPPFYVVESREEVSGFFVNTLKEIFKNTGVDYEFFGYPPKRLYNYLSEGKVDIWMGTKGVEIYEDKTLVVEEKIADINLRCFWLKGTPEVNSPQGLINKKIITILGYNYGGFIKFLNDPVNNIILDKSSSHELAFKKLNAGRAKYLLDYKYPADTVLKKINIPSLEWNDIKKIGIFIHISKKTKNAQELREKLSKSVMDLKIKGII